MLEDSELTPELADRCSLLRKAGFRLALDDVREFSPLVEAFLPYVDIVKLDWPYLRTEAAEMVAHFKRAGKVVLAEKIEHRDEHSNAMQAGCDLFQGFYFARPATVSARKAPASFRAILDVLQLLMGEAIDADVEQSLRSGFKKTV